MLLSIDYEYRPVDSVLVHTGGPKQDDGGAWVPLVYQVGPQKFQSGTKRQHEQGRPVVHKAQLASLSEAKYIADAIARLAAR